MKAQEIFEKAIALIDNINADTGEVDVDTTADYKARSIYLINIILKEVFKISKLSKKFEIIHNPIDNLLTTGFDLYEHEDEDKTFECTSNAKAYTFEMLGVGTATVEDFTTQWNTLTTINVSNTVNTVYSGNLTPTSGATKTRIVFSGDYYYQFGNVALFKYNFVTVPPYARYVKAELPSDVDAILKVIGENPEYHTETYYIETTGLTDEIYLDYLQPQKLRVQYRPIPSNITSLESEMEIDDVTANAVIYALAKNFVEVEQNDFLTSLFEKRYGEMKNIAYSQRPVSFEKVKDVYGGF